MNRIILLVGLCGISCSLRAENFMGQGNPISELSTRDASWFQSHCIDVDTNRNTSQLRTVCQVKEFRYLGELSGSDIYYALYETKEYLIPEALDADYRKSLSKEDLALPLVYADVVLFAGQAKSKQVLPIYFNEDEWVSAPKLEKDTSVSVNAGNGNKVSYTVSVFKQNGKWSVAEGKSR